MSSIDYSSKYNGIGILAKKDLGEITEAHFLEGEPISGWVFYPSGDRYEGNI
jgi:hypothetical protein